MKQKPTGNKAAGLSLLAPVVLNLFLLLVLIMELLPEHRDLGLKGLHSTTDFFVHFVQLPTQYDFFSPHR